MTERSATGTGIDGYLKTVFASPDASAGTEVIGAVDHVAFVQGSLVDRYVILGRLGSGGMGIVYAAYDPELDRRVALKLLLSPKSQAEARTRLLREAQALARLQHPNVVAVYDVGVLGAQVWAAMELVEGVTLKEWLTLEERSWRSILEVMEAVGRGLAAAHQAGLIHRDIKPDNVMISGDGRVRVVDFGLARADEEEEGDHNDVEDARGVSEELASHLSSASRSALRTDLTHEGAILGTPSYMPPELFAGAQADARSDLFGWCVTCWEALHGARPFEAESLGLLVLAVASGRIAPLHKPTTPSWLRRVLERGLRAVSSERYPSMDALLEALALARRRAQWRRRIAIGGVLLALVAGAWVVHALDRAALRSECEARGGSISALWNPTISEEVKRVFLATGRPYAALSHRHVDIALGDYAGQWSKAQAETCVAVKIDESLAPELAAAMFDCLEEGRVGLAVVAESLQQSDDEILENSVTLASSLPPISACIDPVIAGRRPPVVNIELTGPLRQALAEIGTLHQVGKTEEAAGLLEALVPRIEASGNEELRARALLVGGVVAGQLGDLERAEVHLREAFESALAGGMDELAARAVDEIAHNARARARPDEALRWVGVGRALIRRLGEEEGLIAARLGLVEGNILIELGDPDAARSAIERSIEIERGLLGANHPTLGMTLNGLGIVFEDLGDFAQANAHYEEARRMLVASLGDRHPAVAKVEENLGNICWVRGELGRAVDHHQRALEIRVAAFGTEHPTVGLSHLNLGNIFYTKGELDAAEVAYLRALEISEKALGPEHSRVAYALVNLGGVYLRKRELDAAEQVLHRALKIRLASFDREHPGVAYVLANLGVAAVSRGDLDRADVYLVEALATMEKVRGLDHVDLLPPLLGMGEVAAARGDGATAMELFARALAISERGVEADSVTLAEPLIGYGAAAFAAGELAVARGALDRALRVTQEEGADPVLRASACFAAARALAATGDDVEARERAREALALYEGFGPGYANMLQDVRQWLADAP